MLKKWSTMNTERSVAKPRISRMNWISNFGCLSNSWYSVVNKSRREDSRNYQEVGARADFTSSIFRLSGFESKCKCLFDHLNTEYAPFSV